MASKAKVPVLIFVLEQVEIELSMVEGLYGLGCGLVILVVV